MIVVSRTISELFDLVKGPFLGMTSGLSVLCFSSLSIAASKFSSDFRKNLVGFETDNSVLVDEVLFFTVGFGLLVIKSVDILILLGGGETLFRWSCTNREDS